MPNESYVSEEELRKSLDSGEAAVAVFFKSRVLKFGTEFRLGLSSEEARGNTLLERAQETYREEGNKIKVVKGLNGKRRWSY